jgi:hypothetical protein
MEQMDERLRQVWSQFVIPVVYRPGKPKPLWLRLPFASNNRDWLRADHRSKPRWIAERKFWEVPSSWFDDIVKRSLHRFGKVYVIQPIQRTQKCAPACWNARGIECECSCLGANHGSGNPAGKWYVISDTCAVQWGEREYACKLITPPR